MFGASALKKYDMLYHGMKSSLYAGCVDGGDEGG